MEYFIDVNIGDKVITLFGDYGIIRGYNNILGEYLIQFVGPDFEPFLEGTVWDEFEYDFLKEEVLYIYEKR